MSKIYEALKKATGEREPSKEKEVSIFKDDLLQSRNVDQKPQEQVANVQESVSHQAYKPHSFNPHLIVLSDPSSFISEQYKSLRAKLHKLRVEENKRVFVVSSSTILEGKTLTSINLALSMSEDLDKNTVLIDADLRKGSVHSYLGLDKKPGLTDMIKNNHSAGPSAIRKIGNLSVLTTGSLPTNPAELVGSKKMRDLVEALKLSYDFVIIDSAPLVPIVDARLLTDIADGLLFVVKAGKTKYALLEKAVQTVDNKKILGVVLNKVKLGNWSYGYFYYNGDYGPSPGPRPKETVT